MIFIPIFIPPTGRYFCDEAITCYLQLTIAAKNINCDFVTHPGALTYFSNFQVNNVQLLSYEHKTNVAN